MGETRPESLDLGTVAVLNDGAWVYHDGQRTLHHATGTHFFRASEAADGPPVELSSRWYNLDDKLGILCLQGSGRQIYHQQRTKARGRLEQLFHLNHVPAAAMPAQNALLATTAIVFYPGLDSEGTRAAAGASRIEPIQQTDGYRITLDDGTTAEIDLRELRVVPTLGRRSVSNPVDHADGPAGPPPAMRPAAPGGQQKRQ